MFKVKRQALKKRKHDFNARMSFRECPGNRSYSRVVGHLVLEGGARVDSL